MRQSFPHNRRERRAAAVVGDRVVLRRLRRASRHQRQAGRIARDRVVAAIDRVGGRLHARRVSGDQQADEAHEGGGASIHAGLHTRRVVRDKRIPDLERRRLRGRRRVGRDTRSAIGERRVLDDARGAVAEIESDPVALELGSKNVDGQRPRRCPAVEAGGIVAQRRLADVERARRAEIGAHAYRRGVEREPRHDHVVEIESRSRDVVDADVTAEIVDREPAQRHGARAGVDGDSGTGKHRDARVNPGRRDDRHRLRHGERTVAPGIEHDDFAAGRRLDHRHPERAARRRKIAGIGVVAGGSHERALDGGRGGGRNAR